MFKFFIKIEKWLVNLPDWASPVLVIIFVLGFAAWVGLANYGPSRHDGQPIKKCIQTEATIQDKLDCAKAESPAGCWLWVTNVKCKQWDWFYDHYYTHTSTKCSELTEEVYKEECKDYSWKPYDSTSVYY